MTPVWIKVRLRTRSLITISRPLASLLVLLTFAAAPAFAVECKDVIEPNLSKIKDALTELQKVDKNLADILRGLAAQPQGRSSGGASSLEPTARSLDRANDGLERALNTIKSGSRRANLDCQRLVEDGLSPFDGAVDSHDKLLSDLKSQAGRFQGEPAVVASEFKGPLERASRQVADCLKDKLPGFAEQVSRVLGIQVRMQASRGAMAQRSDSVDRFETKAGDLSGSVRSDQASSTLGTTFDRQAASGTGQWHEEAAGAAVAGQTAASLKDNGLMEPKKGPVVPNLETKGSPPPSQGFGTKLKVSIFEGCQKEASSAGFGRFGAFCERQIFDYSMRKHRDDLASTSAGVVDTVSRSKYCRQFNMASYQMKGLPSSPSCAAADSLNSDYDVLSGQLPSKEKDEALAAWQAKVSVAMKEYRKDFERFAGFEEYDWSRFRIRTYVQSSLQTGAIPEGTALRAHEAGWTDLPPGEVVTKRTLEGVHGLQAEYSPGQGPSTPDGRPVQTMFRNYDGTKQVTTVKDGDSTATILVEKNKQGQATRSVLYRGDQRTESRYTYYENGKPDLAVLKVGTSTFTGVPASDQDLSRYGKAVRPLGLDQLKDFLVGGNAAPVPAAGGGGRLADQKETPTERRFRVFDSSELAGVYKNGQWSEVLGQPDARAGVNGLGAAVPGQPKFMIKFEGSPSDPKASGGQAPPPKPIGNMSMLVFDPSGQLVWVPLAGLDANQPYRAVAIGNN